jgi:hypothetical protein
MLAVYEGLLKRECKYLVYSITSQGAESRLGSSNGLVDVGADGGWGVCVVRHGDGCLVGIVTEKCLECCV